MAEWKEYKLEEFAYTVKDAYIPNGSDEFAYIGLEHIEQEALRLNSVGISSDVTSNKFKFKANDVLFGKLRPYFRKVVKPQFSGICSTDIWVFRAKKNFDQIFLFYFLANWDFVNTSNNGEGGTRMPRADWSYLKDTKWILPPFPEQQAIAEVLVSLDDKIDLLYRQNKTLEVMAETLFRQWFVEEAEEYVPLGSLVKVIDNRGKTPPFQTEETDYPIIEVKSLTGNSRCVKYDRCEKFVTKETFDSWFRGHPQLYDILFSTVGSIGEMAMFLEEKGAIAQNIIGIRALGVSPYYLYQFLSLPRTRLLLKEFDISSVQPSIKVPHLLDIEIPLPKNRERISGYENIIKPFVEKMSSNAIHIRSLTTLRDTLLPKLMSGEVRVNRPNL